jgi:hypothetical protein
MIFKNKKNHELIEIKNHEFIKPKLNRTGRFFHNFNRFNQFFLRFGFLNYFFSGFLSLINFLIFLLTPTLLSFHLTNLKTHVYVSYLLGYFNLVFPNKKNKHIKDKFISV